MLIIIILLWIGHIQGYEAANGGSKEGSASGGGPATNLTVGHGDNKGKGLFIITMSCMHASSAGIGLSLICFLFCLIFYSAILQNLPYYSPQCTKSKTYYSH